jgi:hypothetical protein
MRGESFLLIASSLVLLISIVIVFLKNYKYGLINFVVFFVLSYLLYYSYYSIEKGASTTKWLFINILYSWTHNLIIVLYIVSNWFKKKSSE